MSSLSLEETLYLIHHIVLPPQLPQKNDWKVECENALLETTEEALQTFSDTIRTEQSQIASQIDIVVSTVCNLRSVRNDSGFLSDSQLANLLHTLTSSETFKAIPIEIKEQNAAVVISTQGVGADVVFEIFELSPPNETVMMTKGRLKRSFPTHAYAISPQRLQEEGLIESLAQTLARMSCEAAPGFQPQTRKNKEDHDETRDTTHPGLITDFFINIISVIGLPTDVQGVWKSTREDVIWDNALLPWRRSPLWLLVRATMQIQFARISSAEVYKAATVTLLASVLKIAMVHCNSIGT